MLAQIEHSTIDRDARTKARQVLQRVLALEEEVSALRLERDTLKETVAELAENNLILRRQCENCNCTCHGRQVTAGSRPLFDALAKPTSRCSPFVQTGSSSAVNTLEDFLLIQARASGEINRLTSTVAQLESERMKQDARAAALEETVLSLRERLRSVEPRDSPSATSVASAPNTIKIVQFQNPMAR